MRPPTKLPTEHLLLGLFSLGFLYVYMASVFRKQFVVQINAYRVSPWACSAVFFFWVLGMAVCIGVLSLVPLILKHLLA